MEKNEIEITPEMIEAGVKAMNACVSDERRVLTDEQIMARILRAALFQWWCAMPPDSRILETMARAIGAILPDTTQSDADMARAALAALEAAGYVVVPREPTEKMVKAAGGALKTYIEGLSLEDRAKLKPRKLRNGDTAGYQIRPQIKAAARWSAMIEAAKEP